MKPLFQRYLGPLLLALFLVPCALFAATGSVGTPALAGVPTESIWFSKDPFFVGDEITIYAPLFNSSPYRFRGSATVSDSGKVVGVKEFTLPPDGGSAILAFPWTVIGGDHAFSIVISNGEFFSDNKNFVDLPISQQSGAEIKRFVDPQPRAASGESASSSDPQAVRYLSATIPKAIVADTVPILGALEQFRVNQAIRAEAGVAKIEATITSGFAKATSSTATATSTAEKTAWGVVGEGIVDGDFIRTPWEYVKLFFVLIYKFFTANVYAFYVLLCYLAYKIIRGVWNLFF